MDSEFASPRRIDNENNVNVVGDQIDMINDDDNTNLDHNNEGIDEFDGILAQIKKNAGISDVSNNDLIDIICKGIVGNDPKRYSLYGMHYFLVNNTEEMEKYLFLSIEMDDYNLAKILCDKNKFEPYKDICQKRADNGELYYSKAMAMYCSFDMDWVGMLKYSELGIAKGDLAVIIQVADYYIQINRLEDAAKYYLMAIEQHPDHDCVVVWLEELTDIYFKLKDDNMGFQYCDRAIEKGSCIAILQRLCYSDKDKQKYIDKLDLNSENVDSNMLINISTVLIALNEYSKALRFIKKSGKETLDVINIMGFIYQKLGNFENMLLCLNKVKLQCITAMLGLLGYYFSKGDSNAIWKEIESLKPKEIGMIIFEYTREFVDILDTAPVEIYDKMKEAINYDLECKFHVNFADHFIDMLNDKNSHIFWTIKNMVYQARLYQKRNIWTYETRTCPLPPIYCYFSPTQCNICSEYTNLIKLPCSHSICEECIYRSIYEANYCCPFCRAEFL